MGGPGVSLMRPFPLLIGFLDPSSDWNLPAQGGVCVGGGRIGSANIYPKAWLNLGWNRGAFQGTQVSAKAAQFDKKKEKVQKKEIAKCGLRTPLTVSIVNIYI